MISQMTFCILFAISDRLISNGILDLALPYQTKLRIQQRAERFVLLKVLEVCFFNLFSVVFVLAFFIFNFNLVLTNVQNGR